ncbi:RNA polymerase sigma-70 factor [Streptomyces flavofungini]|uniref:RNA polymerase sigma-70 factor n=1 Tax=Streptomyces flavofungini TaxID=68200 RepID=A0ABS0XE99_9ACTN|nr:RNA polymerase sigma-70 factor [Streptomyces flavofungini]MBJ3811520.1 RNA polymerase sigma-70 factor [Streptomyces flavofungini]MBJ3811842.1 RNA polymerase sigma-70 factor [Streptomyces flavofungini]GHC85644.1 DNA-directed RNA polymerase sigma-70 factor [Streptomyces flavofungini]
MPAPLADEFESHRSRLFGLAYRLLGSAQEAEDAVQDAFLRLSGADRAAIERLGAWLAKVVTNLCLNRLTSARARRETYVGAWLPEPVVTSGGALGPLESAEQRDSVSMAFLVLLERLTPVERAVYVLREAFSYSHREIAGVLDVSEAYSRQLHRRAARAVAEDRARFESAPARHEELVGSFIAAARDGDLAGLERLLSEDVTWWGDGGGKATAARRPIVGRDKVARFLIGGIETFGAGMEFSFAEVNGAPALVSRVDGALTGVATFEFAGGRVAGVRAVVNPDKLGYVERQLSAA